MAGWRRKGRKEKSMNRKGKKEKSMNRKGRRNP